ncbi:MAG: FMN-binding negative transcriptional regulator [Ginsengibacter sp.]
MYKLPHFTEDNEELVYEFMQKNSFAILTGFDGNFPVATHVPLDIKKTDNNQFVFTGHMMKNTDHHKAFLQNENVLVTFTGPHCYVSAGWYVKKDVASTWNYMDVQAKGKITFGDEEETKKIIENITNKYEPSESDAAFSKLPKEYVDKLVKAIIGFTIEISSVENVFKLSQNRVIETRQSIVEHLALRKDENSHTIAAEMKKRMLQ